MNVATGTLERWYTWREIHAQPAIWSDWLTSLDVTGLRKWVADQGAGEVWFCGAGTSAYVGDILAAALGRDFRSVATTDLVSRPHHYLTGAPTLIVNFGRSGNSTETLGTLDSLDVLAPDWPRLNITCNADGALATRGPGQAVVLPDACNDRGFAMTSSFSTMLLTAQAVFAPNFDAGSVARLAAEASAFLSSGYCPARPARAVYVGSGSLAFAARESALKVMELSAGQVPALWDSTLGFRHGPKSFVTEETAIHVLISAEPHAAKYDHDLIAELRCQFPKALVTGIGPGGDIAVNWDAGAGAAVLAVLPAQLQGVLWATALGLNVDNPFEGQGTLTRVVDGVRLHEVTR